MIKTHLYPSIYPLFSILFFILSCDGQSNSQVTDNNNSKEEKISKTITPNNDFKSSNINHVKKGNINENAVIYRSLDMGVSWSTFAEGIPKEATLSGIKQHLNKIYVTTDYHGLFVSKDGQDNWQKIGASYLKNLDINCIEVIADNLVIGTLNNGILVSNDGGLSWKASKGNITKQVRAFIKSGRIIYAGTDTGIFMSFDNGESWSHTFGNLQILGFTSLNGKIYAATQNGVLMNAGDPKYWKPIYSEDAIHDVANDGKNIYAMTLGQQLLKTQNDGELWENAQNGIPHPINFYTNELKHIGGDIFSAQWIGVYKSTDFGNNWTILPDLPDSSAFSTLEITDYGIITGISIR